MATYLPTKLDISHLISHDVGIVKELAYGERSASSKYIACIVVVALLTVKRVLRLL